MLDMSEHDGDDAHEAVLTKTLLAALAGKSKAPVVAVVPSGGDDVAPSDKTGIPLGRIGRPTEDDVREFKRRHKR